MLRHGAPPPHPGAASPKPSSVWYDLQTLDGDRALDRARRIGQAALARLLSAQTYAHRAAQVEAVPGALTQPRSCAVSGVASAAGVEVLS